MKTAAFSMLSPRGRRRTLLGILGALVLLPSSASLAAHFSSGFGAAYGGFAHNPRSRAYYTPKTHTFRPHYQNRYSLAPYRWNGRFRSYPYGTGYGSTYGYGNFYIAPPVPYPEPRIYVVPQARPSGRRGSRVINVITMPPRHIDEEYPGQMEEENQPAPPPLPPPPPRAATPEEAWESLQDGQARAALSAFAGLASANQDEGLYKIGYGLAAALNGDKITASYALRRAFESRPESAAYAPIAGTLKTELRRLAGEYRQWVDKEPDNMNARFLYAAVSHFLQDNKAAGDCLDEAMERGGSSTSMASLKKVVEGYLKEAGE